MTQQQKQQRQLLKTVGVLLFAGLQSLLPADHCLSVSVPVIIAAVTVQLFSFAFTFSTTGFLDGAKKANDKVVDEKIASAHRSPGAAAVVQLQAVKGQLGFGGLLLLLVITKAASALGLLDFERPVEGLLLTFLIGGVAGEALDGRDGHAANLRADKTLIEEGCPYQEDFWVEFRPEKVGGEEVVEVDLSDLYPLD